MQNFLISYLCFSATFMITSDLSLDEVLSQEEAKMYVNIDYSLQILVEGPYSSPRTLMLDCVTEAADLLTDFL